MYLAGVHVHVNMSGNDRKHGLNTCMDHIHIELKQKYKKRNERDVTRNSDPGPSGLLSECVTTVLRQQIM